MTPEQRSDAIGLAWRVYGFLLWREKLGNKATSNRDLAAAIRATYSLDNPRNVAIVAALEFEKE